MIFQNTKIRENARKNKKKRENESFAKNVLIFTRKFLQFLQKLLDISGFWHYIIAIRRGNYITR